MWSEFNISNELNINKSKHMVKLKVKPHNGITPININRFNYGLKALGSFYFLEPITILRRGPINELN